jgi:sugar phosphate isomerase/epimerase
MTIGMMTFSFSRMISEGRIDVPGVVRFCAELGLQDVDITERHWLDFDSDVPATVEALEETGLGVACCNTWLDLVTRSSHAKAEREKQLHELFTRLTEVGCRSVMLSSVTNDLSPEEWRKQFGIGLAEVLPVAEDYSITVTFENRGGSMGLMVGTVEHCLEIMRHADDPRLRLTFDVGNFRYVGGDSNEAFDQLADTIAHVHLKDVVPSGDSFKMMPLGEGEVDNAPIIRKLVERGYSGCIAIECGGRGMDLEDARKSVDFVKRVLCSGYRVARELAE